MEYLLSQAPVQLLLLGSLILFVILLFFMILQSVRISRLRKSMNRLLAGTNGTNLEEGLHRMLNSLDEVKKLQSDQQFTINRLSQRIASQCSNVAIVRYNAFQETGSDLSFSIAIIDDAKNGVVITSIFGREESRVYAKPLKGGESEYALSDEEEAAIRKALNSQIGA